MKQVFGLGYPSRPVYTVEEFGDVMVEKMKQEAIVCSITPRSHTGH